MRICYPDARSPSGRNRRPMSRTCGEHHLNSSRRFLEGTWTCLEGSWKELCLNGCEISPDDLWRHEYS
ncbi:Cub Domain-Containing Protein 1 [Manis pentadactyla]|nr:Cub Domain-Containing Protein 1 [Manis pentadactyla]